MAGAQLVLLLALGIWFCPGIASELSQALEEELNEHVGTGARSCLLLFKIPSRSRFPELRGERPDEPRRQGIRRLEAERQI